MVPFVSRRHHLGKPLHFGFEQTAAIGADDAVPDETADEAQTFTEAALVDDVDERVAYVDGPSSVQNHTADNLADTMKPEIKSPLLKLNAGVFT